MKWSQRIGAASGNIMEFYDIAVYAAISPYLTRIVEQQGISHGQTIVWGIFAIRFLIRPFGGIAIAQYAKKYGRKSALILTSTLTGIATLLMAILPVNSLGHYLVLVFMLLQMIQAFSFGGEYPTMINYLMQEDIDKEKGRISSMIVSSSLIGVILSLAVVLLLRDIFSHEQMIKFGWRIPLLIGGLNIVISFWFRLKLPFQRAEIKPNIKTPTINTIKIFLLTIPAAVIFYLQNLASTMIGDVLFVGSLKDFFPIMNTGLLLATVIATGFIVDHFTTPTRSFNYGAVLLFFLGIPLYFLIGSKNIALLIITTMGISIISAMILSNLAAVLKDSAKGHDAALGLGYNVALSVFGGLTPIIIHSLIPYGVIYAGLYVAVAAVPVFLANRFFYLPSI